MLLWAYCAHKECRHFMNNTERDKEHVITYFDLVGDDNEKYMKIDYLLLGICVNNLSI